MLRFRVVFKQVRVLWGLNAQQPKPLWLTSETTTGTYLIVVCRRSHIVQAHSAHWRIKGGLLPTFSLRSCPHKSSQESEYYTLSSVLFPTPKSCLWPPQWGAADAEIKVLSGENTELKRSPFKAWSRQYIAIDATLTARDFFLVYFYPSGPFTCIFSKSSPDFIRSCVGLQNKIGHTAGCKFPCWVPAEYK